MIIVIEGPDGTGKTTLAREFEKHGFKYVHNGPPAVGVNVFDHYTDQIIAAAKQDTVFDRLHLGEVVYGTVIRQDPRLTTEQLRLLNRLLNGLGAKTIFCQTDFLTIRKTWESRREQEYVKNINLMRLVSQHYDELISLEYDDVPNCHVFNFQSENVKEITGYCRAMRLQANLSQVNAPVNVGAIGSFDASFVFVGEKAGGPHDLAFYSYERSSHFLNEVLWDAGYTERNLAFTNAFHLDGRPRNLQLVRSLIPGTFIALGRKAQKACQRWAVPYLSVDHPQYVKRFKLAQRKNYVKVLRSFRNGGN